MALSGLHENLKTDLWPKCMATATKLENIMVNPHKEKYVLEKFHGKIIDYAKYFMILVPHLACAVTWSRGPRPWRGFTHGPPNTDTCPI